MYRELNVRTTSNEYKIFLQNGFYPNSEERASLHSHRYGEIHAVSGGMATFIIDGAVVRIHQGEVLFIPCGIFHCCIEKEPSARRTAFQLSMQKAGYETRQIPRESVEDLFCEIEKSELTGNNAAIGAYIAFLCSLFEDADICVKNVTDPGFIIHEFFANRYSEDIRLDMLAQLLHVSTRQAERLVKLNTGNCFRDELTRVRIDAAKRLIAASDMPLYDIAAYVGFDSYAGFYKAMKRYGK